MTNTSTTRPRVIEEAGLGTRRVLHRTLDRRLSETGLATVSSTARPETLTARADSACGHSLAFEVTCQFTDVTGLRELEPDDEEAHPRVQVEALRSLSLGTTESETTWRLDCLTDTDWLTRAEDIIDELAELIRTNNRAAAASQKEDHRG